MVCEWYLYQAVKNVITYQLGNLQQVAQGESVWDLDKRGQELAMGQQLLRTLEEYASSCRLRLWDCSHMWIWTTMLKYTLGRGSVSACSMINFCLPIPGALHGPHMQWPLELNITCGRVKGILESLDCVQNPALLLTPCVSPEKFLQLAEPQRVITKKQVVTSQHTSHSEVPVTWIRWPMQESMDVGEKLLWEIRVWDTHPAGQD